MTTEATITKTHAHDKQALTAHPAHARTFKDSDRLGLKKFSDGLKSFIFSQYPLEKESFVVSLNSRFGSGKTWFIEMFSNDLKEEGYRVININAWKNDFFKEPVVTILCEIISHIEHNKSLIGKSTDFMTNLLRTAASVAIVTSSQVIDNLTGVSIMETTRAVKEGIDIKHGNEIFKIYNAHAELYTYIQNALDDYISTLDGNPLIILVDELDRCRPDHAVRFIETIKHFFPIKGIIFVLAVDKNQLESTVKCLYGQQLDFPEYYRKFVHRNVSLPPITKGSANSYVTANMKQFFSLQFRTGSFAARIDEHFESNVVQLCRAFNFSLRQMNDFFSIFSHFLYSEDKNKPALFCYIIAAMVYIAILMADEQAARRISTGEFSYADFINFFNEHWHPVEQDSLQWWLEMLVFASSNNSTVGEAANEFISKILLIDQADDGYLSAEQRLKDTRFRILGPGGIDRNSPMMVVSEKINTCLTFYN